MKPGTLVMYNSMYGPYMRAELSKGDVGLVERADGPEVRVMWFVSGKTLNMYREEVVEVTT